MATAEEAVRRLTIEATSRGVKEAKADLDSLAAAQTGVAVASEKQQRATVSVERALARIQRKYDESYRAQRELTKVEGELSLAQSQGLVTLQRRQELLGQVAERHGVATSAINAETAAYRELAIAARNAEQADRAQAAINAQLGVGSSSGLSARASAGVFEAELTRAEEIARQRAAQIGQTFAANLNASLVTGTGKSAKEAAAVFAAEMDRVDDIARMKAQQAGAAFAAGLESSLIAGTGKSARASAAVFEEAAREAEQFASRVAALKGQIDPLGAAQSRLNAELAEYAMLAEKGAISARELAAAQAMAHERFNNAIIGNPNNMRGAQNANNANAAFQVQDIAMMAALGQAPMMTGLQQGPQLANVIQQGGGFSALGAGLASLISPTMLITVGLTAATAALIQFAMTGFEGAKTVDDAFKAHEDTISRVKDVYGELASSVDVMTGKSAALALALTRADAKTIGAVARTESQTFLDEIGNLPRTTTGRYSNYTVDPEFSAFSDQIKTLYSDLKAGAPDAFRVFQTSVENAGEAGGAAMTKLADKLIILGRKAFEANELLREQESILRRIDAGQRGFIIGSPEEDARNDYLDQQRLAMREMQLQFGVDQMALGAKSPGALAEVARRRAELQTVSGENDDARRMRIELAGRTALIQAEYQLTEAQRERARSLNSTVDAQRFELDLIGKTAGEIAGLRLEYEMTAQLREEAARNGIAVDQAEIELIRIKAAEMAKLVELNASRSLMNNLAFDRAQLGRSSVDQQIATQLKGAGLTVDLNSPEARAIRENMQFETLQSDVTSFFNDFRTALENNGGNLGEALSTSVQNAAMRAFDRTMEDLINSISNMIAQALQGQGGGSGGLISSLFGSVFRGSSLSPLASAAIAGGGGGLYSRGGVSTRPSVISEHGQAEAAVPLPDGRRIPVDLKMPAWTPPANQSGGGEQIVHVQIDRNGELGAYVERVSREQAAGVVGQAAPTIVGAAKGATMKSLAKGDADKIMGGLYGLKRQGSRKT